MHLPKPEDVKAQMGAVNAMAQAVINRLTTLAVDYGVHGTPEFYGTQTAFQVTRIAEQWSVYVSVSGSTRALLSASRVELKVLFLENAAEFVKSYEQQIASLYGRLLKVVQVADAKKLGVPL